MSDIYQVNVVSDLVPVLNLRPLSSRLRAHQAQLLPTWGQWIPKYCPRKITAWANTDLPPPKELQVVCKLGGRGSQGVTEMEQVSPGQSIFRYGHVGGGALNTGKMAAIPSVLSLKPRNLVFPYKSLTPP